MDDETIGCGGMLSLASDPFVLFAVWSRDEDIEVAAVAKVLGFRYDVLYGPEYEARLLSIDRREMVGSIEQVLHAERPERVLLPSPSYHQDHTTFFEAGVAATRPLSREGYVASLVASYEYPGSAWRRDGREDYLTYYVDIGAVVDKKMDAIDLYESQRGRGTVDKDVIRSWARLRGSFVGLEYAEAFQLLRLVERGGLGAG
jgi:LmbE family N-acetylglucosaminyl deacetylase